MQEDDVMMPSIPKIHNLSAKSTVVMNGAVWQGRNTFHHKQKHQCLHNYSVHLGKKNKQKNTAIKQKRIDTVQHKHCSSGII